MEQETTIDEVMVFLKENMVTKDDLKTMATKDDLKTMATKEDLKTIATKEGLKDLNEKMESGFATVHQELGSIQNSLDDLTEKTKENADAFSEDILTLDRRATLLEKHVGLPLQPLSVEAA